MNTIRRTVRLIAHLASGDWQCSQCGAWFSGPASQTCPACS